MTVVTDNTNAREALARLIAPGAGWERLNTFARLEEQKVARELANAILAYLPTAGWTPPEAPQQRQERGGREDSYPDGVPLPRGFAQWPVEQRTAWSMGVFAERMAVRHAALAQSPSADTRPAPEADAAGEEPDALTLRCWAASLRSLAHSMETGTNGMPRLSDTPAQHRRIARFLDTLAASGKPGEAGE